MIPGINDPVIEQKILVSLAFVVLVIIFRYLGLSLIRSWKFPSIETKRKIFLQIRHSSIFLILVGLVLVWTTELRDFATSIVAFGLIAFVVGTKELILCFLGGVYKAALKLFNLGDRIKVGEHRGDVIDHNMFGTVLLEIGPSEVVHQYTGRTITLPNSLFLSGPVQNESFTEKYMFHVFTVPVTVSGNWRQHEEVLLAAANRACAEYLEDAEKQMIKLSQAQGLETPSIHPRVWIALEKPDEIRFYIRVPTPSLRKGKIEQAIIRDYLEERPQG